MAGYIDVGSGTTAEMATVLDDIRSRVNRTDERPAMSALGRVGVAARGVLYLTVAFLAANIVAGRYRAKPDRDGALAVVTEQPLGRVLVVVLAAGFVALALWNFGHAAFGTAEDDKPTRRVRDGLRGLLYGAFFFSALPFVTRGSSAAAGGDTEKDVTVRLLESTGGRWLVGAAGAAIVASGIIQGAKAIRGKYAKVIKREAPDWVTKLAGVARLARAGVFVVVGVFVGRVALRFEGPDAAGIDGSLLRLAAQTHGRLFLALAAAAIAIYGAYSLVLVRYGRVVDTDST